PGHAYASNDHGLPTSSFVDMAASAAWQNVRHAGYCRGEIRVTLSVSELSTRTTDPFCVRLIEKSPNRVLMSTSSGPEMTCVPAGSSTSYTECSVPKTGRRRSSWRVDNEAY